MVQNVIGAQFHHYHQIERAELHEITHFQINRVKIGVKIRIFGFFCVLGQNSQFKIPGLRKLTKEILISNHNNMFTSDVFQFSNDHFGSDTPLLSKWAAIQIWDHFSAVFPIYMELGDQNGSFKLRKMFLAMEFWI